MQIRNGSANFAPPLRIRINRVADHFDISRATLQRHDKHRPPGKLDLLRDALKGLGARHVGYGVQAEHYPIVGAILLETFAEFLGENWTEVTQSGWAEAYGVVCSIMLEGAAQAELPVKDAA